MAISPQNRAREFQRQVRASRATLDRLLDRRAVLGLRRYFDQAQDRIERVLRKTSKGARHEILSPLQAQQLLQQVRLAQQETAQRLARMLAPTLEEAQIEGVVQVDRTLNVLEKDDRGLLALPFSEPSIKARLTEKRKPALEGANSDAWGAFGVALALGAEKALSASLALQETAQETIERLRAEADKAWWRGETIVQTTAAYAFNQAQTDALVEVAEDFKGMGKRWCELVDDFTGIPFDNRVGNDSIALHGQVTETNGLFVMPPDPSVHPSFWNWTGLCSPNRPRDRSVTMPWRSDWGIPGWRWVDGKRVDISTAR